MITLNTVNRSLEVVLGAIVSTNQLPVVATYVDITATPTYVPAANTTQTNNTTAVTVVAAPVADTQRQIKFLSVYNADTTAATVIVQYNDNSTLRIICKFVLQTFETLLYTDGEGLRVIDAAGAVKHSVQPLIGSFTQTYSTADATHASRTASSFTDNIGGTTGTTLAAVPDPADTPITADALRDDLVANVLPAIRDALSSLALQHNNVNADALDTAQFLNSLVDDLQ